CVVVQAVPGAFTQASVGLSNGGAAWSSPTPFGTLESRAAVSKRILPSSRPGGSGSAAGVTVRSPVMLETGGPRMTGTHCAFCTHGGVAQSASTLHAGPPGWLQKPPPPAQSLLVPQVCASAGLFEQRRFAWSVAVALATGTTLRER